MNKIKKQFNKLSLESCPSGVTEVIFIESVCQDNVEFLFEIVCFKTTTEKIDFFYNENPVV